MHSKWNYVLFQFLTEIINYVSIESNADDDDGHWNKLNMKKGLLIMQFMWRLFVAKCILHKSKIVGTICKSLMVYY